MAGVAGLVVFALLPMVTFRIAESATFTGRAIYGWLILVPLLPLVAVLLAPRVEALRQHRPLLAITAGIAALLSLLRLAQTSTGFGRSFGQFADMGAVLPENAFTVHWLFILVGAAALVCGVLVGVIGYQSRNER